MNAIHRMSYKIMHLVGVDSLKISPTDILLAKSLLLVYRTLGLVLYWIINCYNVCDVFVYHTETSGLDYSLKHERQFFQ
jgi:hypothetical protein